MPLEPDYEFEIGERVYIAKTLPFTKKLQKGESGIILDRAPSCVDGYTTYCIMFDGLSYDTWISNDKLKRSQVKVTTTRKRR